MGTDTTALLTRRPCLAAFGSEAERLALRCAPDTPLILCDGNGVAEAIAEAARRRRAGESYLVMPVLHDNLALAARDAAQAFYAQYRHPDDLRHTFEALLTGQLMFNGQMITQINLYPTEVLQALREFMQFGDGLAARSAFDRQRIEATLGRKRTYVALAPIVDRTLQIPFARRGAHRVVVWAPDEAAERLAIFSYALRDLKRPAIFVCKGSIPESPHEFVAPEQADDALHEAGIIVDVQPSDPGTILAFAEHGYALVAAENSGAQEYIQGLETYQSHNFLSISAAVSRAQARNRTALRSLPDFESTIAQTIEIAQPIIPSEAPLVSMVIPTYNRRQELQTSLNHFAKQTYPNFEVIVVNDCGEDVSDLVARYPFARYLKTPHNMGSNKAVNVGVRASQGAFVGVIADDDLNYPAQIATLATALHASGLGVAHGNILIRLDTVKADGSMATYGHHLTHDGDLDAMAVHWGMVIHAQGYLVRREIFEQIGCLGEDLRCTSDLDSIIRLSKISDFAHVNVLTGEMAYRDNRSNLSSRVGAELASEIETVLLNHAPADQPLITQRIEAAVRGVAHAQQGVFFRAWVPLVQPVLLPE